jgi:hypothetical protein
MLGTVLVQILKATNFKKVNYIARKLKVKNGLTKVLVEIVCDN